MVRIRRDDDDYILTYKSSGLMVREEYNLPLTREAYEHLKAKADGRIIIAMFVISLFTPKPSAEQIEAITFTGSYKKSIRESWNAWDVVATLGVVALCAAFYIYFW